jgi:hypothetical protein
MSDVASQPETVNFDLGEVLPGAIQEEPFMAALAGRDWAAFGGRQVRLTGCAPLWAYVYVAARIGPHAGGLIVDDGSESGVRVK